MNSMNRRMIEDTVYRLRGSRGERLLEVGFGGGVGLKLLAETFPDSKITGIESSLSMLAAARRQLSELATSGRLELREGCVEALPVATGRFDGVCTVNTIYFWSDAKLGASELARVLAPGGTLAVGLRSRTAMEELSFTQHGFTLYEPEQVAELLVDAGLANVEVSRGEDGHLDFACVSGEKP